MSRQETAKPAQESNSQSRSGDRFNGALIVKPDECVSLVPEDLDLWIQGLVASWTEKYYRPWAASDDPELYILFQGRYLKQFDDALDEKLDALTREGKLPARQPGEDYPHEYLPVIFQAYDEVSAEVGWDPFSQFTGNSRDKK